MLKKGFVAIQRNGIRKIWFLHDTIVSLRVDNTEKTYFFRCKHKKAGNAGAELSQSLRKSSPPPSLVQIAMKNISVSDMGKYEGVALWHVI